MTTLKANEPQVRLTVDGVSVDAPAGATILQAAALAGVHVPTVCFHDHCTANAVCRVCAVEVEGARALVPACIAKAMHGMDVRTDSAGALRARRTTLELLASSVDLSEAPDILAEMRACSADPDRFTDGARRAHAVIDDNPMFVRDYDKCVLCLRCVQVCAEDAQYAFAITLAGRGFDTRVATAFALPLPATTCVFCGQCVGVCPTHALVAKREWLLDQGESPERGHNGCLPAAGDAHMSGPVPAPPRPIQPDFPGFARGRKGKIQILGTPKPRRFVPVGAVAGPNGRAILPVTGL